MTVLSVGEADERVVGKRRREAARELGQRHRLAVAIAERQRAPADDIDLGRTATLDWINDIATNLIVIYKNLIKIIILLFKESIYQITI